MALTEASLCQRAQSVGRVDSAHIITNAWRCIVTQDNWPAVAAQQWEM